MFVLWRMSSRATMVVLTAVAFMRLQEWMSDVEIYSELYHGAKRMVITCDGLVYRSEHGGPLTLYGPARSAADAVATAESYGWREVES